MQESIENTSEYTIDELFEQLKADASWEADSQRRAEIAEGLYQMLGFAL